ncbi:MAG: hypothetical protein IIB94_05740 [Candidatus Marinimicrobia bacterium]|nr:hypothetical protein [Candidatus Neomarinimicrobiota bacterium]
MNTDAIHINRALVNLPKNEYYLSEKYTLEYLIALVTGCLETPAKESGCDHSCGVV